MSAVERGGVEGGEGNVHHSPRTYSSSQNYEIALKGIADIEQTKAKIL
jgi:hypothetical protein